MIKTNNFHYVKKLKNKKSQSYKTNIMSTLSNMTIIDSIVSMWNICIRVPKEFDYKGYVWSFFSETMYILYTHKHELFLLFHLLMLLDITYRYLSRKKTIRKTKVYQDALMRQIKQLSSDKLKLEHEIIDLQEKMKLYIQNNDRKDDLKYEIQLLIEKCVQVKSCAENWQKVQASLHEHETHMYKQKLADIETIMIDGAYNDPEYLAYNGDEWNMEKLNEKATKMNLPDLHWGTKTNLGYVLRIVEQLYKIGDIVEPKYPDGYETQEYEEEEATPVDNKLTVNIPNILIRRNQFNNYEHPETGLVFCYSTKTVIGKQNEDGSVDDLTEEDIDKCNAFKLKFKLPENLDHKSNLADVDEEEFDQDSEEEDELDDQDSEEEDELDDQDSEEEDKDPEWFPNPDEDDSEYDSEE